MASVRIPVSYLKRREERLSILFCLIWKLYWGNCNNITVIWMLIIAGLNGRLSLPWCVRSTGTSLSQYQRAWLAISTGPLTGVYILSSRHWLRWERCASQRSSPKTTSRRWVAVCCHLVAVNSNCISTSRRKLMLLKLRMINNKTKWM